VSHSHRPTRATLYRLAAGPVPPIKLRTEGIPDNSNKITFFYDPVLLAGALGKEGIENPNPHAEERAKFDHIVFVTCDIPAELNKGKTTVTVKLQAHPWGTAGGLFECRAVRAN